MGADVHVPWWEVAPKERHEAVYGAFRALEPDHADRLTAYRAWTQLFLNRNITDDSISSYITSSVDIQGNKFSRLPFNLIRMATQEILSRIGKLTPRPHLTTYRGNWSLRTRARRLQQWVDHEFYANDVYKLTRKSLEDALVLGLGAMKVFPDHDFGRPAFERVWPGEIIIDPYDAMYGSPRQLIQRRLVPRRVLTKLFPKKEAAISSARRSKGDAYRRFDEAYHPHIDQVEVLESWHLPTTPKSGDGRHSIVIETASLVDEEWSQADFPFAFIRYEDEPRGFFGYGLAETLLGAHLDFNVQLTRINEAHELVASPTMLLPKNSGLSVDDITNEAGQILVHNPGAAPSYIQPQAMSSEAYQHLDGIFQRGLQVSRLSSLAFGSQIPAGLETGAAVRSYHDVETEGLSLLAQDYERMVMQVAKLAIRAGKSLYEADPGYTVVAERDKNTIAKVPWGDVDMDEDDFVLRVTAASSLSLTASGKIAQVSDLIAMQVIDPQTGGALLDFPDLEAHMSLERSSVELIDKRAEAMLDDGKYVPPEPTEDLQLSIKRLQMFVNRAQADGVPEDRIGLLRKYITQANGLLIQAETEAMANAAPAATSAPLPDVAGQVPTAITGQEPGI